MSNGAGFYYRNKQKKEGAFSEAEFIRLIQNEIIEPDDEFWMLDMENWMRLGDSIYSFYLKPNQKCASNDGRQDDDTKEKADAVSEAELSSAE